MLFRSTIYVFLLSLGTCLIVAPAGAKAGSQTSARSCALAPADQDWLEDSVSAWNYAVAHLALADVERVTAVIFDRNCKFTSSTAMTGGAAEWSGNQHNGSISLPDGKSIPAGITSFAAPAGKDAFFVMAAPSIWRDGGVKGGELPLEKLMTAVLLHEGSHVLQFPTYGKKIAELTSRYGLPDSFNDDSIQGQFEADQEFAASVLRETELLFAAAAASDLEEAKELAGKARALMLSRQDRWFRGKNAYLRQAEEIWLSMEGSGQWLAYRWLTDPEGGGLSPTMALAGFAQRGKWWSQKQGIALFLALERIAPAGWKALVFGGGSENATQLLDAALAVGD